MHRCPMYLKGWNKQKPRTAKVVNGTEAAMAYIIMLFKLNVLGPAIYSSC